MHLDDLNWGARSPPGAQAGGKPPRLTFHELRHTHATLLLRAGVPVPIVAKRLGHKDPSVTLNV
jgi:integrase